MKNQIEAVVSNGHSGQVLGPLEQVYIQTIGLIQQSPASFGVEVRKLSHSVYVRLATEAYVDEDRFHGLSHSFTYENGQMTEQVIRVRKRDDLTRLGDYPLYRLDTCHSGPTWQRYLEIAKKHPEHWNQSPTITWTPNLFDGKETVLVDLFSENEQSGANAFSTLELFQTFTRFQKPPQNRISLLELLEEPTTKDLFKFLNAPTTSS